MNFLSLAPWMIEQLEHLEQKATSHPWRPGQLQQSILAGHSGLALQEQEKLVGFLVWHQILDEAELLNIAVAPDQQGRGMGGILIDELVRQCLDSQIEKIHLEVRESNARARRLYLQHGFIEVGRRKQYYPTQDGREDAILMSLHTKVAHS